MTTSIERLDELLLSEATDHLSDEEVTELESLLTEQKGIDRYAYDRAASAFFLAVCARPGEQMPKELSSKLESEAARCWRSSNRG
jgi:DNA-binding FadR family transcriptional regulator